MAKKIQTGRQQHRQVPQATPHNPLLAAVQRNPRKVRRALIEIDEQTRAFYRQDIGRWRRAHEAAADVDNPRRADLYNVYSDVVLNTHLEGCMGQLEEAVMAQGFDIRDRRTNEVDRNKGDMLRAKWFRDLLHYALEAEAWGNSLVELGNVTLQRGILTLDGVTLIPRAHVVPERGIILRNVMDDLSQGIDYRNNPRLSQYIIEINGKDPLGYLLKVSPEAIAIKNAAGFWDSFGELFGIPVRWATTTSDDPGDKASIMSALKNMGAAAYGLFPEGTEIKFLETQRGDAFEVFDRRIVRAERGISKAVLNQTMTLEDGSSLSQAEVHLEIFDRVVRSRMRDIADMVNTQLLPRLQAMGLPFTDDDVYAWDDSVKYTPEQQLKIEQMVLQYYDIDPQYIKDKYNIPVLGVRQASMGLGISAEIKKKSPTMKAVDELYGLN